MSGAWTVKLTEIADIVHRRTDITRQIQKGVDQHRPMPCRQHETVAVGRSEEHTSELQSLMRTSYAVFCLKKKTLHSRTTRLKTAELRTKNNQQIDAQTHEFSVSIQT